MMRRALRSSLLLAALLAASPVHAASPSSKEAATRQQLQQAEQARAAAVAARKEAEARAAAAATQSKRLAIQRDAALARLHAAEAATTIAADRMGQLQDQRKAAAARLAKRAEAIRPLLPLIERLSLYPAETLLAVPAAAEDRLRGVLVLQGLTRQLQQEAAALRHDQTALRKASEAVQAQLPKLDAARAAQQEAARQLDAQLAESEAARQQAADEAAAAAKRAADLAGKAENLRAMLKTLEAQRRAAEAKAREEAARAERHKQAAAAEAARKREAALAHPTGPGTLAGAKHGKGQLVAPVAGKVVRAWGELDRGRAGDRHFLQRGAEGAGGVALQRAGGFRRSVPQLRIADDRRLRRRLPRRAGGVRAPEYPGGAGGEGRSAGWGDAGLGPRHQAPAGAVCGAAT